MPGLRMQPGLFFFPLYHTYEAVKDFNVPVALAVYDGAFPDLDVVNQFLDDFPVKPLHIQIRLHERPRQSKETLDCRR